MPRSVLTPPLNFRLEFTGNLQQVDKTPHFAVIVKKSASIKILVFDMTGLKLCHLSPVSGRAKKIAFLPKKSGLASLTFRGVSASSEGYTLLGVRKE